MLIPKVLLAALLTVALTGSALAQSSGQSSGERANIKQEPQTQERGTVDMPLVVERLRTKEDRDKASAEERAEYDKATREVYLNVATWIIAIVTTVLAAGTILLAYYTYNLWGETKTIADDAKKSSERQLRAYVGITITDLTYGTKPLSPKPGTMWTDFVVSEIKNYGSTPAQRIIQHLYLWQMPWPQALPADFPFTGEIAEDWKDQPVSELVLNPQQSYVATNQIVDHAFITDAIARKTILYLYGHVDYVDVFDKDRRTVFCVYWQPWETGSRRFIQWNKNNSQT